MNKQITSKTFISEQECDNFIKVKFGDKPETQKTIQGIIRFYEKMVSKYNDTFIVVYETENMEEAISNNIIQQLIPNTDRKGKMVYEGTIAQITKDIGLGEDRRVDVRKFLLKERDGNDLIRHSVTDKLYPKTIYTVGAYWRIEFESDDDTNEKVDKKSKITFNKRTK